VHDGPPRPLEAHTGSYSDALLGARLDLNNVECSARLALGQIDFRRFGILHSPFYTKFNCIK
jgi:hypothetical protein